MTTGTTDPTSQQSEYSAFKPEQRGIELIPEDQRPMRPANLFWLWAGAIWNIEFLVYGALIMSFGLSFGQAAFAIVVGNLSYALLGVASLQGPETGTTAFMVSRAPFGPNGNRMPSLFNWLTQVGFEVEGLVLIVFVLIAMFNRGGIHPGTGLKVVLIVATVLLQFIVPFLGHPTITKLLNYLAVVFIVVFAVMAILVVPHVDLHRLAETRQAGHNPVAAPWQIVTTAIVLLIAAGGLGWTENGNDYSRYLPRRTPATSTFWAATLGPAIPSILLELLGAAAFSVSPASTEVTGVPSAFAAWFFWPFLILTLPQLFAINSLDLYSSGVTLQALGAPVNRLGAVVIDTILAGGVTALVIFRGSFLNDLSGFLGYIVVWLAPWFGVLITDWLLRRGRYEPESLANDRGGVYWRHGGVHWNAIVALVTGGVAAALWINGSSYQPSYVGPISSATGGTDFSWLIGIVVASAVYWALCRRSVPAEGQAAAEAGESAGQNPSVHR